MTPEVAAVAKACEAVIGFFFEDAPLTVREAEPVGTEFSGKSRVVVLGVEGAWRGSLVLLFEPAAIPEIARRFMGMELDESMASAADDVLIELGNQIAARACREIEEAGIGWTDLTPPSLIQADGPIELAWNRGRSSVLVLGNEREYLRVAIGLSPGPKR